MVVSSEWQVILIVVGIFVKYFSDSFEILELWDYYENDVINRGGIKRGLTRNPNHIDYQNYQSYGT